MANMQGAPSSQEEAKSALDVMVEGISKKRGVTTVEKSHFDWEKYKREKALEEELKDAAQKGVVEKQEFLHRVDERLFEKEKEERDKERARRELAQMSAGPPRTDS